MEPKLKNYLAGELLTTATCWKLTFATGKVIGFTDYDKGLNIDNILYKSSSGFMASSIILNSDLKTSSLEIDGILNNDDIRLLSKLLEVEQNSRFKIVRYKE